MKSVKSLDKTSEFLKKQPFTYIALGDSTVEGLGASEPSKSYVGYISRALENAQHVIRYYNLGKDKARLRDLIAYQLEAAISLQPDLVTISIGANDIRYATSVLRFEQDLHFLFLRLQRETQATIIINTIPDLSVTPAVPRNLRGVTRLMVKRFNKRIIKLAQVYNTVLVDLSQLAQLYTTQFPEILSEDGFHPSDFGYALWANAVLSYVPEVLHEERSVPVLYREKKE